MSKHGALKHFSISNKHDKRKNGGKIKTPLWKAALAILRFVSAVAEIK